MSLNENQKQDIQPAARSTRSKLLLGIILFFGLLLAMIVALAIKSTNIEKGPTNVSPLPQTSFPQASITLPVSPPPRANCDGTITTSYFPCKLYVSFDESVKKATVAKTKEFITKLLFDAGFPSNQVQIFYEIPESVPQAVVTTAFGDELKTGQRLKDLYPNYIFGYKTLKIPEGLGE